MNNGSVILETASQLLVPDAPMTISEWADTHRILSPGVSAEPGRWDTNRVPYAREWMDAILIPVVEDVTLMVAAQSAKSSCIENTIGYFASHDPAPIMLILPTDGLCDTVSKTRLDPMIADTPILRERFAPESRKNKGQNTLDLKMFVGGSLFLASAKSPSSLSSRTVRLILADEIDRFPTMLSEEGDVLALAAARQTTFFNKKSIFTSTPTLHDQSRIESLFLAGDQRYYHVPCPHCAVAHRLTWANFKFEHDGLTVVEGSARMVCPSCGTFIDESEKYGMLLGGQWVPTYPERKRHRSYHLHGLYSPWISWTQLAEEFLKAVQGGEEAMIPFINLRFGEPATKKHETSTMVPQELLDTRVSNDWHSQALPMDVLYLTCGIDVQKDRLEALVVAWGTQMRTWTVERKVFNSNPDQPSTWVDVDEFIQQHWKRADGRELGIDVCMIDSGYQTPTVRAFTTPRFNRRVYATIGRNGRDMIKRESDEQGNPYTVIASDQLKDLILTRLLAKQGEFGRMEFSQEVADLSFFEQLTSERPVVKYERGVARVVWVQDRLRNEALDCMAMNIACTYLHAPNWEALLKNRAPLTEQVPTPSEAPTPTPAVAAEVQQTTTRIPRAHTGGSWMSGMNY